MLIIGLFTSYELIISQVDATLDFIEKWKVDFTDLAHY